MTHQPAATLRINYRRGILLGVGRQPKIDVNAATECILAEWRSASPCGEAIAAATLAKRIVAVFAAQSSESNDRVAINPETHEVGDPITQFVTTKRPDLC